MSRSSRGADQQRLRDPRDDHERLALKLPPGDSDHPVAGGNQLLVAVPIALLNEVNSMGALVMARGDEYLSVFDTGQRYALSRLFLILRSCGFDVAGIFWGLWLFPLGVLVYRSRFLPRFLGVLLIIGTFAYLANSFTSLLLPQYETRVSRWMDPLQAVELVFMLWLLIKGGKPQSLPGMASTQA